MAEAVETLGRHPKPGPFGRKTQSRFRKKKKLDQWERSFRKGDQMPMTKEFLNRADRAIAENERLIDELVKSMRKAEELDNRLHYLHNLRVEDAQRSRRLPQLAS